MGNFTKIIRNPGMKVHGSDYYTTQGAVPTTFHHFLNKRFSNGKLNANYLFNQKQNSLYDPTTGITWNINGTMSNRKGQTGTWNTKNYSYSWNKATVPNNQNISTKSQATKKSGSPTVSTNKPRISTPSTTGRSRTAPKAPTSNSWINKGRGIWNYNGVSQADVANAYKTGDFSKVGSYLSQHKDLASYLNNIYSKRGGNQFNQSTQTPIVNTMTLQMLDNVVPKSPVKEFTPTAELPSSPNPTYNRSQTRVQNQSTQKRIDSIGTNQLLKPKTDTNKLNNQLVNLKFKKGGQMYKYQAGAQMVQPQQTSGQQGIEQQAMALVQAAMQGDQQANQTIQKIMQAAQQGDQQAAQVAQLLKTIVQQMKGSRKARLGAKLDYIKQSIGECPEGQEVVYFKKGGEICKVCAGKKMQNGGKSDPIKNFKKKKEQDAVKQAYQRNPYTRGKSAKEIAEMQRRNRQEAGVGKGENDANVAPWNYKKKR